MLKILTARGSIAAAQELLRKHLAAAATRKGYIHIGYQGGGDQYLTYSLARSSVWFACKRLPNRFWNAFGLGDPFKGTPTIITEINPPLSGVRRSIAGAFAEDEQGFLYLVHRGNIGGGRKGIGKEAFLDAYSEPLQPLDEGGTSSHVIVVGALEKRTIVADIERFTLRVQSIKDQLATKVRSVRSQGRNQHQEGKFRPEFRGKRKYTTRGEIEANVTHGIVVDALRDELERLGLKAFRTQSRDLYVPSKRGRKLHSLFEVKTDLSSTSVYIGVGQLMMHGGGGDALRQILVAPAGLDAPRMKRLRNVGIRIVTFRWTGGRPVLSGLTAALR
jgi:hypothetical protein